jgi:hypothetical protein
MNIRSATHDAEGHMPEVPFFPNEQLCLITCIYARVETSAIAAPATASTLEAA